MIGRNYHIQDYLRILCKFIYVSNGKFLNLICLSILILGVFRTKQELMSDDGHRASGVRRPAWCVQTKGTGCSRIMQKSLEKM